MFDSRIHATEIRYKGNVEWITSSQTYSAVSKRSKYSTVYPDFPGICYTANYADLQNAMHAKSHNAKPTPQSITR
jgi:hypothetical protein